MIHRNSEIVALDLAQFTINLRRQANALFEKIKKKVFDEKPAGFAGLSGCIIYVNYGMDDARPNALPPSHREDHFIRDLIDQLSGFRFDSNKWYQGDSFPEKLDLSELNLADTAGGGRFIAVPLTGSVPTTSFFHKMGFEMGLGFYTRHNADDAWQEVSRLANAHDKPEIAELLISAGAPNEQGFIYPSDEYVINLMLEECPTRSIPELKYIKQILIHKWSSGDIWRIYPDRLQVAKGIYQGLVPSHMPIRTETS